MAKRTQVTKKKPSRTANKPTTASGPHPQPIQTIATTTTSPTPRSNPTNFYLRIEGLNISTVIDDTDQLSVARGSSFLLKEAITDIKANILPDNAIVIATGASIGEFQLPATTQEVVTGYWIVFILF